MVIFTLSQFMLTVGPNCTTFLIPAEVFPTRVRGTAHGISAAAGKCGAILTSFAFGTVEDAISLEGVLGFFSGVMMLTALVTLLIPEIKGHSLEAIERGALYGDNDPAENSIDGSVTDSVTHVHVGAAVNASMDKVI